MENKYLYPDSTNIFDDKELEFRVSQINDEGTNIKEVFEANLVSYIHQYKRFDNNWDDSEKYNSDWIYDRYLKGELQIIGENYNDEESPCAEFVDFELNQFFLEPNPKCQIYCHFLETHKATFQNIDRLIDYCFDRNKTQDSFRNFANKKLQEGIVNFEKLDFAFFYLEEVIVKTTIQDLIHFLQFKKRESYEKEISQVFDMDYFLNPALIQDPIELKNYREVLRAWVNKMGQDLKHNLNLPVVPPITEWMASEIGSTDHLNEIQNETKDYPKYIFTNYKAFDLFDTIAKEMTTHPQISFLFRQMSEKEKPALIVVENSDFVKWFNQQNYGYTLDYTTKTYEQSKTEDRIALYKVVKNLKMST
jgi:hypothetical protein